MRNFERSKNWKKQNSTPPPAVATEPPPDSSNDVPPAEPPSPAVGAGKVTVELSLDAAVFLKYAVSKFTLSAGQPNLSRSALVIEEILAALADVQVIAKA